MTARRWKFVLIGIALAGVSSLLLFRYLLEGWDVHGDAMVPTLPDGAFVISRRVFGDLDRADVVVLGKAPDGTSNLITRVVGLAGDAITLEGPDVRVNGRTLQHEPASADGTLARETLGNATYLVQLASSPTGAPSQTVAVPGDHVFVMADNRRDARDSRTFGPISVDQVQYKVLFKLPSPE